MTFIEGKNVNCLKSLCVPLIPLFMFDKIEESEREVFVLC